jgi:hypothetical protein
VIALIEAAESARVLARELESEAAGASEAERVDLGEAIGSLRRGAMLLLCVAAGRVRGELEAHAAREPVVSPADIARVHLINRGVIRTLGTLALAFVLVGCTSETLEDVAAMGGACRWLEDPELPKVTRPPAGGCIRLRVENADRRLFLGDVDACEGPPPDGVQCIVVLGAEPYSVFARRSAATEGGIYYSEAELDAGACPIACD